MDTMTMTGSLLPVSAIPVCPNLVQGIVERDLLGQGELAAATRAVETEAAAVVGTPLAVAAIGTGVFFAGFVGHQYTTFRLTAFPSNSWENALPLSALTRR